MATLSLKPNSRKKPTLAKPSAKTSEWEFADTGVMNHKSGFSPVIGMLSENIEHSPTHLKIEDIRLL